MNQNIAALAGISTKQEKRIIGLMSGTSLDGLDIALCRFNGHGINTRLDIEAFETISYTPFFREQIREVFSRKQIDLEKLCVLNNWVALQHAQMINGCLQKWDISSAQVDLIASHGQTIYHAPKFLHPNDGFGNATLQIGDGDHLAVATGIITVSDFRQKHIAAGGEGAPLAVYGDYLLFSDESENRIMLNIGGISNLTFLPASKDPSLVFSSDIGPGNTLMDAYIQQQQPGIYFDADAGLARSGRAHDTLLQALMDHPFFSTPFPRTIGPELFNLHYLSAAISKTDTHHLSAADVMATLNLFSATMIARAIRDCTDAHQPYTIYTSGGGMHNPLLMSHIREQLPDMVFHDTSLLSVHPDAKEAILFAILANEAISGKPISLGGGRQGIPAISMGKISFPS
jgi:anhydro-N-acetylmuramic acid kinase